VPVDGDGRNDVLTIRLYELKYRIGPALRPVIHEDVRGALCGASFAYEPGFGLTDGSEFDALVPPSISPDRVRLGPSASVPPAGQAQIEIRLGWILCFPQYPHSPVTRAGYPRGELGVLIGRVHGAREDPGAAIPPRVEDF